MGHSGLVGQHTFPIECQYLGIGATSDPKDYGDPLDHALC